MVPLEKEERIVLSIEEGMKSPVKEDSPIVAPQEEKDALIDLIGRMRGEESSVTIEGSPALIQGMTGPSVDHITRRSAATIQDIHQDVQRREAIGDPSDHTGVRRMEEIEGKGSPTPLQERDILLLLMKEGRKERGNPRCPMAMMISARASGTMTRSK